MCLFVYFGKKRGTRKIGQKLPIFYRKCQIKNYQRSKRTLPISRYGLQKLNYQRLKLPISRVTNIEVYLYLQSRQDIRQLDKAKKPRDSDDKISKLIDSFFLKSEDGKVWSFETERLTP